jgi:hypothetical protein
MTIKREDCGILYFLIAGGRSKKFEKRVMWGYGKFLLHSVNSLRKHMPDISTALFTDIEGVDWSGEYGFDVVTHTIPDAEKYIWTYKYECLLKTPFSKTIHMDCDTYVCNSFYEVFDMLDNIDFAAPLSPAYFGKVPLDVPVSFPELAGGFMAYNSSDKVIKMLEHTKKMLSTRPRGCDEPYLRKALYQFTNVKHSVLPFEYNCVFWFPGYVMSKVRVLHGKNFYPEVIEECFAGSPHPKLYSTDSIIYCDYIRRRTYNMGAVKNFSKLIEEAKKK